MNLTVAIVIVGYRNAGDIATCLAALEKSTYRDFEVVICENGGDLAFLALQQALPATLAGGQPVRLVQAPNNGGYASGINIAMALAREVDAWWILNPDTEPSPGAIAALVQRFLQGFDAVGTPLLFPSGEIQSFGGRWSGWRAKAISLGYGEAKGTKPDPAGIERTQNFLSGASMFVGRTFLAITGPMEERYFLYCEEVDWFLRAGQRGLRLGFAPDAVVIHHQGTTTGYDKSLRARSGRSVYLDERNKMLVTVRFFPWRIPVAACMALVRLIGRYGREGAFVQIAFGVAGWFMGLLGSSGVPGWARGDTGPVARR
jgi:GT2 family glycosyltransferase